MSFQVAAEMRRKGVLNIGGKPITVRQPNHAYYEQQRMESAITIKTDIPNQPKINKTTDKEANLVRNRASSTAS